MTEQEPVEAVPSLAAAPVAPYEPFPSFADFAATDFDRTTFEAHAQLLESAKESADGERLRESVRTATRWAAVDTGAIEGLYEVDRGFTFSVAASGAAWDNLHLVIGDDAGHAINDALAAYDFVLDAATGSTPVTESWIREVHEVICASQETYTVVTDVGLQKHSLERGKYKRHPNNPFNLASAAIHSYASVDEKAPEMHRLVSEMRSKEFQAAHPVLQAAYAHYAFVCVHPFADGNGRVSRALASVFLYRSPGVPLVIFADQKPSYIDALEAADAGNFSPFIGFIADRAIDVVRMVVRDLRREPRVPLEDRLRSMEEALSGRGGLTHAEVDALSVSVSAEFSKALDKAIQKNAVRPPLTVGKSVSASGHAPKVQGYRSPPQPQTINLNVSSAAPASAQVARQFTVWIAKGKSDIADFVIVEPSGRIIEDVLIRDVVPFVSPSLTYRLEISAEEELLAVIDRAVAAAEAQLKKSGYRD